MSESRSSVSRPTSTNLALGGRTIFEPADDRSGHRYTLGGAVTCNVGKIVNLSPQGALVMSRTPLLSTVPFTITDGACRVVCDARVLRTRRIAEHRHSYALQFEGLRPEQVAALEYIIAQHHIPHGAMRGEAA